MTRIWGMTIGLAAMLCLAACAGVPATKTTAYDRLYVFGDSYSDIGFGYLDGNGPTAVAYMAEKMGLALSQTKAADWKGKSLDFAFSGAGTGDAGSRTAQLGYGMIKQGQEFAGLVSSGQIHFDPDHTLFFVAGGLNDRRLTTEQTKANLTQLVTLLRGTGAKHFRIALLPEKIPAFSEIGIRLNPMLAALPAQLSTTLAIDARGSRWGAYYDEVMTHAASLGFTNTTDACSGREIFKQLGPKCAAPDSYFYYHGDHPSTAVHRLVGAKLFDEIEH